MTLIMNQEGEKVSVVEAPTYIVAPRSTAAEGSSRSERKGIQAKHVLIGVGVVFIAGLIITGILVGMHIFAEQQKDIIKFSLDFKSIGDGKNVKQEVESDPNDNVVRYRITKDGKIVDIVNDFNREMQVVRLEFASRTDCYISALNRSAVLDPSQINGPEQYTDSTGNSSGSTVFKVASNPVSDRSFLPKKAQDMCKDVSVYWAYRTCMLPNTEESDSPSRDRRATLYCISACGIKVCSFCGVRVVITKYTCYWYTC